MNCIVHILKHIEANPIHNHRRHEVKMPVNISSFVEEIRITVTWPMPKCSRLFLQDISSAKIILAPSTLATFAESHRLEDHMILFHQKNWLYQWDWIFEPWSCQKLLYSSYLIASFWTWVTYWHSLVSLSIQRFGYTQKKSPKHVCWQYVYLCMHYSYSTIAVWSLKIMQLMEVILFCQILLLIIMRVYVCMYAFLYCVRIPYFAS